ncbi:MAG: dTDP-glucose 4,6-dehydratase [Acidobacteriota bacterium]
MASTSTRRYLVTGGAGFIGSNFVRHLLVSEPDASVVNLDKLTYAGNLENLKDVEGSPRYRFVKGDICDRAVVEGLVAEADVVLNFAAETHVDRSILDPGDFIQTDVFGTYVLLEAMRRAGGSRRFVQISTDEVYGSVAQGSSKETDPLDPRNPYSASKAGADRLAYSYHATYGMDVIVTRASNNYGPYQYPEKLIPLFITNAVEDQPLPLYGDGMQIRDWLHVEDHCGALSFLVDRGVAGQTYNIGGGNERANVDITRIILRELGKPESLIRRVTDRPGHDRRYSLDTTKIRALGFTPSRGFEDGLESTIRWYVGNPAWWRAIKERKADFQRYYREQYRERLT